MVVFPGEARCSLEVFPHPYFRQTKLGLERRLACWGVPKGQWTGQVKKREVSGMSQEARGNVVGIVKNSRAMLVGVQRVAIWVKRRWRGDGQQGRLVQDT